MSSFVDFVIDKCISITHFKQAQAHLLTTGLFQISPSRTKLLDLCASSTTGNLHFALLVFNQIRAPVTNDWNSIIRGLAQSINPRDAMRCYTAMAHSSLPSSRPDALTYSFTLKGCARGFAPSEAWQLHCQIVLSGFKNDALLHTSLLDAYSKSGDADSASRLFDEMQVRDVVTWNAFIAGLAHCSRPKKALYFFEKMKEEGPVPNSVTMVAALSACAMPGTWTMCDSVCKYVRDEGYDKNVQVCNAVIDMYSRRGLISKALAFFSSGMKCERNVVSWNTIIMGMAMHGYGQKALEIFELMGSTGPSPDGVTYLAALCACNHSGLVDDGFRLFTSMAGRGVGRDMRHYGCVVDMLGRTGRLHEAYEIIVSMPVAPDAVLWQTLLAACNTHEDVDMAEVVWRELASMDSCNSGDFVLMSNLYAYHERWSDVGRVRKKMRTREVKKDPGGSFTEVNGVPYHFHNGHLGDRLVREKLEEMMFRLKGVGYVPQTKFVLHDIDEEEKESLLFCHSEKLAVAFSLVFLEVGSPIQVINNMRICADCHVVIKLISRIYGREIVVRDRVRFHAFKDGYCSCGDYW